MKTLIAAVLVTLAAVASAAPPIDQLPADRPLVSGPLSRTAVHQVAFLHRNEIQACYDKALATKPGLSGKVVAEFIIGLTGSVSHVKIAHSTVNDSAVENCVVNRVSHWRFPRPAKGGTVAVTYPWMLRRARQG